MSIKERPCIFSTGVNMAKRPSARSTVSADEVRVLAYTLSGSVSTGWPPFTRITWALAMAAILARKRKKSILFIGNDYGALPHLFLLIQIALYTHFGRLLERHIPQLHLVDFTIDRQGFVGGDADDVGQFFPCFSIDVTGYIRIY